MAAHQVTTFFWSEGVCVCVRVRKCICTEVEACLCESKWLHKFMSAQLVCARVCVWSINLCEGEPGVLLTRGLSDWCVKARLRGCVRVCSAERRPPLHSFSHLWGFPLVRSQLCDPAGNVLWRKHHSIKNKKTTQKLWKFLRRWKCFVKKKNLLFPPSWCDNTVKKYLHRHKF